MKHILTLFIILFTISIHAQIANEFIESQDVKAYLLSNSSLFSNESNTPGFIVKQIEGEEIGASTIFSSSLWLGGKTGSQSFAVYQIYSGIGYNNSPQYIPGVYSNNNFDFNQVWKVKGTDILSHIEDFQDGSIDETPSDGIMNWPGKGNPFLGEDFPDENIASFFDQNQDGLYDPMDGDYPIVFVNNEIIIPLEMAFAVTHVKSDGTLNIPELQINTHLYTLACDNISELDRAVFTQHRITNKSVNQYKNVYAGLWMDHDLGAYTDDYFGSNEEKDLFYAYNADPVDGPAIFGEETFDDNPPIQGTRLLSHELSSFITPHGISVSSPPGMYLPETVPEVYNNLQGKWRDGIPLSYGGDGYDPSNGDENIKFIFPDNPLDEDGWSMFSDIISPFDRSSIAGIYVGDLNPEQFVEIDMVHLVTTESSLDHIEKVEKHFEEMDAMKSLYENLSTEGCNLNVVSNEEIEILTTFTVIPNPAKDIIQIVSEENIDGLLIYNSAGILIDQIFENANSSISIDYAPGIYFVSALYKGKKSEIQKLVVH